MPCGGQRSSEMAIDILQIAISIAILLVLAVPFGRYMAAVYLSRRTFLDPVLDPIDNAIYRLSGVGREGMCWRAYRLIC